MIQSNSTRLSRRVDAYARFTSDAVGASPHFGPLFVTLDARRRELALAADAYRGPVRNPTGAPPVLIVGATGDDETPYAEAVALQSQLGNAGCSRSMASSTAATSPAHAFAGTWTRTSPAARCPRQAPSVAEPGRRHAVTHRPGAVA